MNELKQYNQLSKLLHWVTALLIFGLLAVGYYMASMDFSEDKLALYALHKSFGLLVLGLVVVRVVWHTICKKPKSLPTHTKIEKSLAHSAHAFLYLALFAIPLSGWVMSSAGDFSIQFFGINMPDIVGKNEALFHDAKNVHEVLAVILAAVVGLHILGALKHHFIDRDTTLKRMTSMRLGLVGGFIFTICIGVAFAPALFLTGNNLLKKLSASDDIMYVQEGTVVEVAVSDESAVQAPDSLWNIDHENSHIKFSATQYGQSFEGAFEKFDGEINFDPEDLQNSSVKIIIDIASIKTGSYDRDGQAISSDWFNVNEFPRAEFTANNFDDVSDGNYIAYGDILLRGVSMPVELPFSLNINEGEADMAAEIVLDRLDFGVGQGQWQSTDAIGNRVEVMIQVKANRN